MDNTLWYLYFFTTDGIDHNGNRVLPAALVFGAFFQVIGKKTCNAGRESEKATMPNTKALTIPKIGLLLFLSYFVFKACTFASYRDAEPAFILDKELKGRSLTPHLSYFVDSTGRAGIADVASRPEKFLSLQGRSGDPSFGFSRDAYWFMFSVKNEQSVPAAWILDLNYPLIDFIELYIPDNGSYRTMETGDRLPFDQREMPGRSFAFPLMEPPGEQTYFLRVESSGSLIVPLKAWSPAGFQQNQTRETMIIGLIYGALLAMAIYHFCVYFWIREKSYLYLGLLIIFAGLFSMTNSGIAFQYLWPGSPAWGNTAFHFFLAFGNLMVLQFSRIFLNTKDRAPKLDLLMRSGMVIALTLIPLSLVIEYYHMAHAITPLTLFSAILLTLSGISLLMRGYREARYFLLAFFVFIIGTILIALRNIGLIPETQVAAWFSQIGLVGMSVILSFGVAAKVEYLSRLASVDHLTGLLNRRVFLEKLEAETDRFKRYGVSAVLMILDLDHFKNINDKFGHAGGDRVLRRFAKRLKKTVRKTDIVGRLGGEEFAVLLSETTMDTALPLADRILEGARKCVVSEGSKAISFTTSIGIAELQADDTHMDRLLARADAALYRAKNNGRDRVVAA